jgi:hypothetical protein
MRLFNIVLVSLLMAKSAFSQTPAAGCWAEFSARAVKGGNFVLRGRENSPVLFAFLALTGRNNIAQSRAASIILQSLDRQYSDRGLRVVAMDASAIASRRISRHEDIVNRVADWNLKFPVLEDPTGSRAQAFHVLALPTIVLISADGTEIGRWEGYTRTPVLAQAIERLLGGPLGQLPDTALRPENTLNKYPQ